ncbi:MAG TPA: hypothetical protein VF354_02920 [Candidatus Methanoperedens sp.]
MVNKRVTPSEDPLVHVDFLITKSQKRYLDDLGSSKRSAFIRKLIDAQINTYPYAAEKAKLKESIEQKKRELNIEEAQFIEYQAEETKALVASQTREQLLEKYTDRYIKGNQDIDFTNRDFDRIIKINIGDINRIIGGNGEPVTYEELKILTIKKAEARGMHIYE